MKAYAKEECEKLIADIDTQALRVWKKKLTHLTLQALSSDQDYDVLHKSRILSSLTSQMRASKFFKKVTV